MQALREYLAGIIPGPIFNMEGLDELVALSWGKFTGDGGGMTADKVWGRMEQVQWDPPWLTFKIERHGGTVRGSTRAELQQWSLNIDTAVRTVTIAGFRQLRPRQAPLNVQPLVDEIADLIEQECPDPQLKRNPDGSVRVHIGQVVPDNASKQTVEGRRRRFSKALRERLLSRGWTQAAGRAPNTFVRAPQRDSQS